MAGWGWFLATGGIVYGSCMALGMVVMVVYKIWSLKSQKQKFRQEVDYYAEFVKEYHSGLARGPQVQTKQQCSLEAYSQTVWTPVSATNDRDYRKNCGETLSASLYGDDLESQRSGSPLPRATRLGSISSWSIYDEDQEQFTRVVASSPSPTRDNDEGEACSPSASTSLVLAKRPRLTLSTAIWPMRSSWSDGLNTPTTGSCTSAGSEQEETFTPCTGTEYSPATSIASSSSSSSPPYTSFEGDCFETVGLGEAEDEQQQQQQWHESVARMSKRVSSAVQLLFVNGKTDGQETDSVSVRECNAV